MLGSNKCFLYTRLLGPPQPTFYKKCLTSSTVAAHLREAIPGTALTDISQKQLSWPVRHFPNRPLSPTSRKRQIFAAARLFSEPILTPSVVKAKRKMKNSLISVKLFYHRIKFILQSAFSWIMLAGERSEIQILPAV